MMISQRIKSIITSSARIILTLSLSITAAILFFSCSSVKLSEITAVMPNMSVKADSVYRGSYSFGSIIVMKATVEVTVKNSKITSITIIEHSGSPIGKKAEDVIIEQITGKQSLNVDAVSGATASSKVILKAVENTLL